jgi:hypothetical protein
MPIADDWDFDYPNKVLQHVDGVLSYDTGTAGQAAAGQYIRGGTSGAIGKVIAVTGNAASGTYTLTNVVGQFVDGEAVSIMSEQPFDAVTAGNGGFAVGDTVVDQVTGTIDVKAIEYNMDGLGGGIMYGDNFTAFTNDSQLDISGGQTDVADADTTGTDNDAVIDTAVTNGTLAVPGTANTNDSVIIHYSAGSVAIPEQAIVEDATTGAIALVEQTIGVLATGSLRLVDYDSTGGVFTDTNTLRVDQVIGYNNQVAGQVFSVGDVVVGATSSATGRVLADTGTQLILADESGTWTTTEDLEVGGVKIAEANGTNTTLNVATINLPNGIRTEQRPNAVGGSVGQGGIYASADSLNIVRKINSWYTLSQDTFDELLQMDDDEALDAAFKGFAYSLVFDWVLGQGSDRFLRQGALIDTTGAEVWANPQTQGAQNKITDTAYLIDTTQTFRQPQLYIEQNGVKVDSWWLEGNIDVLLRVRTRQDTRFIAPATPTLGQLIPGGDPAAGGGYAVLNREFYTSTYDATGVDGSAGVVNSVALGTADDTVNNNQGTHTMAWDGGSAVTLLVGEEFYTVAGNSQKVGIVVAQTGDAAATGTVEYVLKSGTQFADGDTLTAIVSGKTFTVNEPTGFDTSNSVVAGFSNDIRFSVVDITATPSGGTGITGTFQCGEGVIQATTGAFGFFVIIDNGGTNTLALEVPVCDVEATIGAGGSITGTFQPEERVTQATTGATGILLYADTTSDILYIRTDTGSAAFAGDNNITGDQSGASWAAGTTATYADPPAFSGDNDITGLTSGATWDAGTGATYPSATTFTADLNNGDGNQPFAGAVSGDLTGAAAETIQNVYQWSKYLARHEAADPSIEGPGTADLGNRGNLFRRLKDTYSEVKPGNPFGTFTGSLAFGQGWFLDTACIAAADIRSFSVVDDNGVLRNPPNLQSLSIIGIAADWRASAFRSTGAGLFTILRTEFDVDTPGGGRNQSADTIIRVGANTRTVSPLPADVPNTGVLRVLDPNGSGNYLRFPYSSVDRILNDFTLASGTIGAVTGSVDLVANDNVHVVFIEETSTGVSVTNTVQYVADIPLVYKARLKGFKSFRSTGTFGTGGAELNVVQTPDTIVDLP